MLPLGNPKKGQKSCTKVPSNISLQTYHRPFIEYIFFLFFNAKCSTRYVPTVKCKQVGDRTTFNGGDEGNGHLSPSYCLLVRFRMVRVTMKTSEKCQQRNQTCKLHVCVLCVIPQCSERDSYKLPIKQCAGSLVLNRCTT